jgi:hypothetical protein
MIKDGQIQLNKTSCDLCSEPAVTSINGRLYCKNHSPDVSEKRGSEDETLKNAHERLSDLF